MVYEKKIEDINDVDVILNLFFDGSTEDVESYKKLLEAKFNGANVFTFDNRYINTMQFSGYSFVVRPGANVLLLRSLLLDYKENEDEENNTCNLLNIDINKFEETKKFIRNANKLLIIYGNGIIYDNQKDESISIINMIDSKKIDYQNLPKWSVPKYINVNKFQYTLIYKNLPNYRITLNKESSNSNIKKNSVTKLYDFLDNNYPANAIEINEEEAKNNNIEEGDTIILKRNEEIERGVAYITKRVPKNIVCMATEKVEEKENFITVEMIVEKNNL